MARLAWSLVWRQVSNLPVGRPASWKLAAPTNSTPLEGALAARQPLGVLVPAVLSVVLQSDVALARVVLVGDVELVPAAVGPPVRLGEQVQVHARHLLAVQLDGDEVPVAGDDTVVPLPDRLHGVLRRLGQ